MRLRYYLKHLAHHAKPTALHARRYAALQRYKERCDPAELERRLAVYLGPAEAFELPPTAVAKRDFKRTGGTVYWLDVLEFLPYFQPGASFLFKFGDDMTPCALPTIAKMRSMVDPRDHAVIFKLNKWRHFRFVRDRTPWRAKADRAVWRGLVVHEWRKRFVERTWEHPLCDIGQTHPQTDEPWCTPRLTIPEQLRSKFIFSIEGNDVATNLKWIMSSNSLCVMPKPKVQSWFCESQLEPGVHYARIADDYSDVDQVLRHYLAHPAEAERIIANAQAHVARFRDPLLEDLLCIEVLERYTALSGQLGARRFAPPLAATMTAAGARTA